MEKKKVGRPPIEKPLKTKISIRLDDELLEILDDYCKKHNLQRAEAIREGIKRLPEKKK